MIDFENTAEGLVVTGVGLAAVAHSEQNAMLYWLAIGSLMMAIAAVQKRERLL